jgi:hypothetical protein
MLGCIIVDSDLPQGHFMRESGHESIETLQIDYFYFAPPFEAVFIRSALDSDLFSVYCFNPSETMRL